MQAETEARAARAAARLAAHVWGDGVLEILRRLGEGGHQAWLVGGSVRDALLGRASGGIPDVATDLTPAEVAARFPRVAPTGIRYGTVLIVTGAAQVECTTLREDGRYDDARRPDSVRFTADPLRDLARRDFTVNAMAWDPFARRLLDPFGGLADLEAGVLRAVGDARARFEEDALRPLRLARFAATHAMTPAPGTAAAMAPALARADGLAAERIGAELLRLMEAPRPSRGLEVLRESGWLARVLPEVDACAGVTQNRFHAHDVYRHTLLVCDAAPAGWREVRWAALMHDIGKPATRAGAEGEATFHGHETLGAELAAARLAALRFPLALREAVVHLVREHIFDYRPEWSDAAVRRWLRRVGPEHVDALFALRAADVAGMGRAPADAPPDAFRARIAAVLATGRVLRVEDLPVGGADVMRILGCGPGPRVGAVLRALLEDVIEDPAAGSRAALLAKLERLRDADAEPAPGP